MAVAAVGAERNLPQEEETHLVKAILGHEVRRRHHVAQRLGHLDTVVVKEAVDHDPLGQLQPGAHQERRPINGVEPGNVLADHVDIGRPVLLE
ncbi:hypothetical protein D9M72_549920 [compost metagenome]